MVVALEGGGLLRALLLLLSWPVLCLLGADSGAGVRLMTFVTFCGMRTKDAHTVARAVLPKFFFENLRRCSSPIMAITSTTGKRVVHSLLPRVMVEAFLKNNLGVESIAAAELSVVCGGCYFSGLVDNVSYITVIAGEKEEGVLLLKHYYPKPLVFHDGRLAFLPTPSATLALFLFLPLGALLMIVRSLAGITLPYKLALPVCSFTGARLRVRGLEAEKNMKPVSSSKKGVLYVCTHRTLLDPLAISSALSRPLTAVTYSLSRMSELLSPIRTRRLCRDRVRDAATMARLLREGDLVVCPEGTTCREPYLLRFSPLFAEIADEIAPVAVDARCTMFYGTTATGAKWLDPVLFLMNPSPEYQLQFLGRVAGDSAHPAEVANALQAQLAHALGFQATMLTRRDKYLMLAGNEGVVDTCRKSTTWSCIERIFG